MNYSEVYNLAMPKSKREAEKHNYWVVFVIRPLSVLLTIPLVNTKIKPITITAISVFTSLVSAIFLGFGQSVVHRLCGLFFIFIWAVLDGVDGNLARCQGTCSKLGELWDAFGGYLALVLAFLSVGVASHFDRNSVFIFDNYWYLLIGGITSVVSIFPRLIYQKKKAICPDFDIKHQKNPHQSGLMEIVQSNIAISGGMQLLLLVAILFHVLNLFLLFYLVLYSGVMILSLRKLLVA